MIDPGKLRWCCQSLDFQAKVGVHFQKQILLKVLPADGALHLQCLFLQTDADHGNKHHQNQCG